MKRRILHCMLLIALSVNLFFGYRAYCEENAGKNGKDETIRQIDLFMQVFQLIRTQYVDVDKVSSQELFAGAMEGMLRRLDQHSVYLPKREYSNIKEDAEGKFGGIGITYTDKEGRMTIVDVKEGAPGEKAGLKRGDVITSVDGKAVREETAIEDLQKIKGAPGTKVKVGIYREETREALEFEVERQEIELPNVLDAQVLPESAIGYVRLNQFMEPSAKGLEKVFRDFEGKGVTGIVLDLRGNPGGLLKSAAEICSFFLPAGKLVCTVRHHSTTRSNRESENFEEIKTLSSKGQYRVPDKVRVAILMDRNSASASEVTAACLRDYNRAALVGEKSYGKGSVQNLFTLPEGAAVKLTIARYYSPDPRRPTIDHHGIQPDIPVSVSREKAKEILEAQKAGKFQLTDDPFIAAGVEYLKTGIVPKEENSKASPRQEKKQ